MNKVIYNIYKNLGIHSIYLGEEDVNRVLKKDTQPQVEKSIPQETKRSLYHKKDTLPHQEKKSQRNNITPQHKNLFVDIEKFDPRFKKLCHSIKRTPCVWTYYHLGEDIFGEPCALRRRYIQEVLTALSMPQGTYSFLPFTAPDNGELRLYKEEFLGMLTIHKPSLILFFGGESIEHIVPQYTGKEWEEFMVISPVRGLHLPSMERLPEEKDRVVRFLKEYTKRIGIYR